MESFVTIPEFIFYLDEIYLDVLGFEHKLHFDIDIEKWPRNMHLTTSIKLRFNFEIGLNKAIQSNYNNQTCFIWSLWDKEFFYHIN